MHLRRALLLLALVVFVVAAVGALVAPREQAADDAGALTPPAVAAPPPRTLELRFPARGEPRRLRIAPGAHVVLEVRTSEPGEARIAGLELVQAAEPATPARFDLLAERPGSYEVTFAPVLGTPAAVGRLVVASPG
jgi:hypothetical protein